MSNIQLIKKILYTGTITLKTGLHIGGTNASLNIGGPDKFVVRNPINSIPYIPGSSLKGKMRALIEIAHKSVDTSKEGKVGPSKDPTSKSASGYLFGVAADTNNEIDNQKDNENDKKKEQEHYASRLIIRDAELITKEGFDKLSDSQKEEFKNKYGITKDNIVDFSNTDLPYTESKTEVQIDRVTSKANPRTFERVPAGAVFTLNMVLNIFENDKEDILKDRIKEAIMLLQDDYLGGNGSRGYGEIEIKIIKKEPRTLESYYAKK
jgi:CRISPR-associated protein Csm3